MRENTGEYSRIFYAVTLINESLNDPNNSLYAQWYLMSLDIIDSKIL